MPDIEKVCKASGEKFVVTEWEQKFLEHMGIPLPTLSINERHRRRLAHRNERSIYKDECDISGRKIVSLYNPGSPYKVLAQNVWYGDDWDARDYGRDYDFSRPFFEQFADLEKDTPHMSLINLRGENSEYCNVTNSNKNCYLVFGGDYCEDTLYSVFSMYCSDSSDLYWVVKSQLTYDCVDCQNCYKVKYSQNSENCQESSFLFDCKNLKNCFGCVGLRNKEYHIFNKPYTAEEYAAKLATFKLDTWSGIQHIKKEFAKFKLQFPHRATIVVNSENVTGDNIIDANNCKNCFDVTGPIESCKDVLLGGYDAHHIVSSDHVGFKSDYFYEMLGSIEGHNNAFCGFAWTCSGTFYSDMVMNSQDLFGCTNMNRAKYCILNKQYKKEEYFELRAKIIEHMKSTGEWGEFLPMDKSLFAYNETVANDYFPLTKEEALAKGLRWYEEPKTEKVEGAKIPDSIHDVTDDILKQSLVCEKSGKVYRMIPQELKLYRELEIPIPHFAPETRNKLRFAMRTPRMTWPRECMKCQKKIQSTYAPDRPEKIHCEDCYLKAIY